MEGLVAALDDAPRLHHHAPGSLVTLAKWKITPDLMDGSPLDHAAEDTAPQPARRNRSPS